MSIRSHAGAGGYLPAVGVHHPYGRDDTVILDNAAPYHLAMHFPMLAPIFASRRSTEPVALLPEHRTCRLLDRRDATRSGAAKHKPARRGGCGTETALGKRYLAAHGYSSAPPPISEPRWTQWRLPGPLSSPRAQRGGWASTSVRCKVFPRSQHAHLLPPCLACVRVHICPCFAFRPGEPAHLQGPALSCHG